MNNEKWIIRSRRMLLIVLVVFLPACRVGQSAPRVVNSNVQLVSGEVFIIREGMVLEAESGFGLLAGDLLYSAAGSLAEFFVENKAAVRLDEGGLVRIVNLTGEEGGLDCHIELLTGLLSFQVDSLDSTEIMTVEADGTEYVVKGTTFVLEHRLGQSRLVVGEGSVEARQGEERKLIGRKQEFVPEAKFAASEPQVADEDTLEILKTFAPLARQVVGEEEKTVKIDILVYPLDADIYINGRRIGKGRFQGHISWGKIINVRVRKRGYIDETVQILSKTDNSVIIELKPQKAENKQTPETEKKTEENKAPVKSGGLKGYEMQIGELTNRLNNALNVLASSKLERIEERDRIRNEMDAQVEIEKARTALFETKLNESQARVEQLKEELESR